MHRFLYISILMSFVIASEATAISVGYDGSVVPFQLTYQPNVEPSIKPILQVINTVSDAFVAGWQIKLEVRPASGSHGQLLFNDVSVPPNSLFGQDPRSISLLLGPSDTVLCYDFATQLEGALVAGGTGQNIIEAALVASPDAEGPFDLVMRGYSAVLSEQDNSSSWLPADAFDPIAFDNSESGGVVQLGTINVSRPAQLGDYDHDGSIGNLDYICWRSHFGSSVTAAGDSADGNRNFSIDAADYVDWRKMLPANVASTFLDSRAVPEPAILQFFLAALAFASCTRSRRKLSSQTLTGRTSD